MAARRSSAEFPSKCREAEWSWLFQILPFMEGDNIYKLFAGEYDDTSDWWYGGQFGTFDDTDASGCMQCYTAASFAAGGGSHSCGHSPWPGSWRTNLLGNRNRWSGRQKAPLESNRSEDQ